MCKKNPQIPYISEVIILRDIISRTLCAPASATPSSCNCFPFLRFHLWFNIPSSISIAKLSGGKDIEGFFLKSSPSLTLWGLCSSGSSPSFRSAVPPPTRHADRHSRACPRTYVPSFNSTVSFMETLVSLILSS